MAQGVFVFSPCGASKAFYMIRMLSCFILRFYICLSSFSISQVLLLSRWRSSLVSLFSIMLRDGVYIFMNTDFMFPNMSLVNYNFLSGE